MKLAEYVTYFEEAAKSNLALRHLFTPTRKTFRRMNIDEILTSTNVDLVEISMVLENYTKRGKDLLSDNKRKLITGAFHIIKQVDQGNYDGEVIAMDETEAVTEQILAKMLNDVTAYSMDKTHPYQLKGFDPNTIVVRSVHDLFDGWHGWRTEFILEQSWANNLVLKNEHWIKDKRFIP